MVHYWYFGHKLHCSDYIRCKYDVIMVFFGIEASISTFIFFHPMSLNWGTEAYRGMLMDLIKNQAQTLESNEQK